MIYKINWKVNLSQYNIELRFPFNEHSSILIHPMKVTFDVDVNYLLELNKVHMTPFWATSVRKNVTKNEHKDSDEGDDNAIIFEIRRR